MGERPNQEVQEGDEAETALKYCKACKELHPTTAFWRNSHTRDGYFEQCKESIRRAADPEKTRARNRRSYERAKERISEMRAAKRVGKRMRKTYKTKLNPFGLTAKERGRRRNPVTVIKQRIKELEKLLERAAAEAK